MQRDSGFCEIGYGNLHVGDSTRNQGVSLIYLVLMMRLSGLEVC
jgi:hypothetical protein